MNFALLVIQWLIIFALCIALAVNSHKINEIRGYYREALKELDAARAMASDIMEAKRQAERDKTNADNYKRLCTASDEARKAVLERGGIIPCAECKHLVELKNGSQPYYLCAHSAGKAHIWNPESCYCSEAKRKVEV